MELSKFILCGEDKKCLSTIKSALTMEGHIFLGYLEDAGKLVRNVQAHQPELIVIDVGAGFRKIRSTLELLDDEAVAAILLILDREDNEAITFMRKSRTCVYIYKALTSETIGAVAEAALANFKRVVKYETEIKKLNGSLESRKQVDKAKWLLMERNNISEPEAHALLINKSREKRISLKELAEAIILAEEL